jgi:hypothetical protein
MTRTAPKAETTEYAAMLTRMVRSYSRRIADGNPSDLADAIKLQRTLDEAIGQAVANMRATTGYSWAELAVELGVTRQAAQQRFGRYEAR